MEEKVATVKIKQDLHDAVKIFCIKAKIPLSRFYSEAVNARLSIGEGALEAIEARKKKKK